MHYPECRICVSQNKLEPLSSAQPRSPPLGYAAWRLSGVQWHARPHDKSSREAVLENALVLLQGQMTAFVVRGSGFEPRPVEIGDRNGGMVVVKSGLEGS